MKPGRELDAIIAEKVMGLELMTFKQEPWQEPYAIGETAPHAICLAALKAIK